MAKGILPTDWNEGKERKRERERERMREREKERKRESWICFYRANLLLWALAFLWSSPTVLVPRSFLFSKLVSLACLLFFWCVSECAQLEFFVFLFFVSFVRLDVQCESGLYVRLQSFPSWRNMQTHTMCCKMSLCSNSWNVQKFLIMWMMVIIISFRRSDPSEFHFL